MRKGFLSICLAAMLASFGYALVSEALKGRVYDSQGNPLQDVKVEVVDTSISTYTDCDGIFELEGLEQDPLRLRFTHPEFTTQSAEISLEEAAGQFVQIFLTSKNPIVMTLKEEVAVTAEADSIIDVSLPSHRTILPSSVLTEMGTANIAESVDKVPGVASVGKGGYSMAPAIRGLAEHRVLLLVDGVRITSERRIGASASFINLGDIDRVEINRGPYSVFYGSGAVGGIINIITKSPSPDSPLTGDFYLSYNTNRSERAGAAALSGSLGKWGIMFGANAKKADDYSSPSGPVTWSRYSDYNFMLKVNRQDELSRFYTTLYHYQGDDIGKPSPTSEYKPRWYPNETNTLFTLGYERQQVLFLDNINLSFYALNNLLETQADNLRNDLTLSIRNLAEIEGTNFGFRFRGAKRLARSHTLNLGIDYFGQMKVNDRNTEWRYDTSGGVISKSEEVSLQDARRGNFGLYLDDKVQLTEELTLSLGGRFDYLQTSNLASGEKRLSKHDEFLSLYAGVVYQTTSNLSLLANVGRSFRFPTISELFYTGLTGRGTVFGNPDLEPEESLNFDIGIRYLHERFYASLFGFSNGIDKMIQKYTGTDLEEYFYRNLTAGRVNGVEGELYVYVIKDVEFFFNFHHMRGRDKDTDAPLNYIPPTRLTFWGKYSPGRFWVEPRFTFTAGKNDPGPLEIEVDGYVMFDTILGYELSENLTFLAIAQNLLDQTYRASADEKGVDAPGRGLVVRAKFSF
jgi:outer membrane receptor protein involved in Fe transport